MNTIGVLGGRWRATVSAAGCIQPWGGEASLDWFVAADDRWHVPAQEAAIRQRRLDGAPVFETRLRVPTGDAVHRVWCVADGGGFTVIEVENESTLPFAVAFSRADLLSVRPPAEVPIEGISLPAGSVVFPVGHHSTIRVALAHTPGTTQLPDGLASAAQVARGWETILERAGRIAVPEESVVADIAVLRCELALNGPVEPSEDPVAFLLDVGQLVRLGERADPWVPDVADAIAAVARRPLTWDVAAALDAAALVLHRAGETRAVRDVARMRSAAATVLPSLLDADCNDSRVLAWHEQRLARCTGAGGADLLSGGIPDTWLGANFEAHQLPIGPAATVSFAVRWHGERPAVLWEVLGDAVRLTAATIAPEWAAAADKGEALWPAPAGAAVAASVAAASLVADSPEMPEASDTGISFS
ncbi:unannotated protein [freshwater metagenome]|uniref:Unannotated protein n=1 Tax=freshwater metagenome TaxID=449393 RepID=A0A6J7EHJ6_9ZZZZ